MSPAEVADLLKKLGLARSREFTAAGINPKLVATALKRGFIEQMDRGTYSLPGFAKQPHARLLVACKRVPGSVVCLQSAAYFHGLINEEPPAVWLAIDSKSWRPSSDRIAMRAVWFSGNAMSQGVMNQRIEGIPIRVFSPMKTIADLLKYRNKVGIDVALQSLRSAVAMNQYSPIACYIMQASAGWITWQLSSFMSLDPAEISKVDKFDLSGESESEDFVPIDQVTT